MTRDEATTILAGLTAAFPNVRLEEDTPEVWRKHLAALDFDIADRAVGQCVDNLKFFPSIAEFREFYRLERHNSPPKLAPDPPARKSEIPEWVDVWWWARRVKGETRSFPQLAAEASDYQLTQEWREMSGSTAPGHIDSSYRKGKPEDAMTVGEYEELRQSWIEAGSPHVSSVEELTAAGVGTTP